MAERCAPFRSKPTQEVCDLLESLQNTQLFLVQRPGPTSFIVREEGSEVKRKVAIGARITCSCSPVGSGGTCRELCLHVLFALTKVLRVPPSNPLVWQLSYSDRELEDVLRMGVLPSRRLQADQRAAAASAKAAANAAAAAAEPGQVARREVDEEEPCPICYEEMHGADLAVLVYCRFGCGRNVHGKCMGTMKLCCQAFAIAKCSVWADHQVKSLGKELTCPLCRCEWGEFKWKPPPPKRNKPKELNPTRDNVHCGSSCGSCKKAPLVGKRFRCLICADFDLCEPCFSAGQHAQHTFAVKDSPTAFAMPADRPLLMPSSTRIAAQTLGIQLESSSSQHSSSQHTMSDGRPGVPSGSGQQSITSTASGVAGAGSGMVSYGGAYIVGREDGLLALGSSVSSASAQHAGSSSSAAQGLSVMGRQGSRAAASSSSTGAAAAAAAAAGRGAGRSRSTSRGRVGASPARQGHLLPASGLEGATKHSPASSRAPSLSVHGLTVSPAGATTGPVITAAGIGTGIVHGSTINTTGVLPSSGANEGRRLFVGPNSGPAYATVKRVISHTPKRQLPSSVLPVDLGLEGRQLAPGSDAPVLVGTLHPPAMGHGLGHEATAPGLRLPPRHRPSPNRPPPHTGRAPLMAAASEPVSSLNQGGDTLPSLVLEGQTRGPPSRRVLQEGLDPAHGNELVYASRRGLASGSEGQLPRGAARGPAAPQQQGLSAQQLSGIAPAALQQGHVGGLETGSALQLPGQLLSSMPTRRSLSAGSPGLPSITMVTAGLGGASIYNSSNGSAASSSSSGRAASALPWHDTQAPGIFDGSMHGSTYRGYSKDGSLRGSLSVLQKPETPLSDTQGAFRQMSFSHGRDELTPDPSASPMLRRPSGLHHSGGNPHHNALMDVPRVCLKSTSGLLTLPVSGMAANTGTGRLGLESLDVTHPTQILNVDLPHLEVHPAHRLDHNHGLAEHPLGLGHPASTPQLAESCADADADACGDDNAGSAREEWWSGAVAREERPTASMLWSMEDALRKRNLLESPFPSENDPNAPTPRAPTASFPAAFLPSAAALSNSSVALQQQLVQAHDAAHAYHVQMANSGLSYGSDEDLNDSVLMASVCISKSDPDGTWPIGQLDSALAQSSWGSQHTVTPDDTPLASSSPAHTQRHLSPQQAAYAAAAARAAAAATAAACHSSMHEQEQQMLGRIESATPVHGDQRGKGPAAEVPAGRASSRYRHTSSLLQAPNRPTSAGYGLYHEDPVSTAANVARTSSASAATSSSASSTMGAHARVTYSGLHDDRAQMPEDCVLLHSAPMTDTLDSFRAAHVHAADGAAAAKSTLGRPSTATTATTSGAQQLHTHAGSKAPRHTNDVGGMLSASVSLPGAGMPYCAEGTAAQSGLGAGTSIDALSKFMHTQQHVYSNPVYQRPYTLDL